MAKLESRLLIKSIGSEINNTYDSLRDKIIDYLELIKEFDRKKLFIAIKLRSYIDDTETVKFIDTVLNYSYNLIMIEGYE